MITEYPGYSLYKGKPSESQILKDSDILMEFIIKFLKIPSEDIIIMGCSLGSGPAIYISSKYNIGLLVLISAFSSIKQIVKDLFGKMAAVLVKDSFNNESLIKKNKCHT